MNRAVEKKGRKVRAERVLLQTLAVSGVIAMAVLAPNAVGALKKIDPHWEEKINPRLRISHALYRLKRKGLITTSPEGVLLTKKGNNVLRTIEDKGRVIKRPLRWDGRWRIVLFDVPERKRGLRDKMRTLLQKAGFIKLQQSAWVYPYDCEEVVALMKSSQHLGKEVQYIVADVVENDQRIRDHFGLRPH